jgi:hypothetical protein
LVEPFAYRPDADRLQQALGSDALGQLLERLLVELLAVVVAGHNGGVGNVLNFVGGFGHFCSLLAGRK